MIDALCGVAPEEDFVLPDGDVESWNVNQVAGWAATKLSARTARALRTNEVDGALLIEAAKGVVVNIPKLVVRNDSYMFRGLYKEGDSSTNSNDSDVPEYLQIRGYELIKGECRTEKFSEPGEYTVKQ